MRHLLKLSPILLLVPLLLLAACEPAPQPEATRTPQEMLAAVTTNLRDVQTLRLLLEQEGAEYPFSFSADGTAASAVPASIRRGRVQFVAPDVISGTISLNVSGMPISVDVFVRGPNQYMRLPAGRWLSTTLGGEFDPADLTREGGAFEQALLNLEGLEYIGYETLPDGTETEHLRGVAPGPAAAALLLGLVEADAPVTVNVYIDTDSGLPALLTLEMLPPGLEDTPQAPRTLWRLEVYDINAEPAFEDPEAAS